MSTHQLSLSLSLWSLTLTVSHVGLALTDVHIDELGSLDAEETQLTLGGHSFSHQRLTRTRRAVQQNA